MFRFHHQRVEMLLKIYQEAEEEAKIKNQRYALGGTFASTGFVAGFISYTASVNGGGVWIAITSAVLGMFQ